MEDEDRVHRERRERERERERRRALGTISHPVLGFCRVGQQKKTMPCPGKEKKDRNRQKQNPYFFSKVYGAEIFRNKIRIS
jgi:hypothetical protein